MTQENTRIPPALLNFVSSSQREMMTMASHQPVINEPQQDGDVKPSGRGRGRLSFLRNSFSRKQNGNTPTGASKRRSSKLSLFFRGKMSSKTDSAAEASRKAMKNTKKKSKKGKKNQKNQSLQEHFDEFLMERGYSTQQYNSLDCAYHCEPTPLQKASFGTRVSQAARQGDERILKDILEVGLSPNPCNRYGESLVHMVCRKGNYQILRVLLAAGCSLQVSDDYGRTPLHDACWGAEPNFDTIKLLLDNDRNLFRLLDSRGSTPLDYVRKEHYSAWKSFLSNQGDRYWPRRDVSVEGKENPPVLTKHDANSFPILDPKNALPLQLAEMVANGQMEPQEALFLLADETDDDEGSLTDDDDYSESDSDDDDDGDSYSSDSENDEDNDSLYGDDDDDDEDSDIDADEMAEFCLRAGGAMAVAQRVFEQEERNRKMAAGL